MECEGSQDGWNIGELASRRNIMRECKDIMESSGGSEDILISVEDKALLYNVARLANIKAEHFGDTSATLTTGEWQLLSVVMGLDSVGYASVIIMFFYEAIRKHQHSIAGGNFELMVESLGLWTYWVDCCTKASQNAYKFLTKPFIVWCLQAECNMEREESEAWASFYLAKTLLKDGTDRTDLLKESLAGEKSTPPLRYFASQALLEDDEVKYGFKMLEAAMEMDATWTHAKICQLEWALYYHLGHGEYTEAREIPNKIYALRCSDDDCLVEGFSLFCQAEVSGHVEECKERINVYREAIAEVEKVCVSNISKFSPMRTNIPLLLARSRQMILRLQIAVGKVDDDGFISGQKRVEEKALTYLPSSSPWHETFNRMFLTSKGRLLCHQEKYKEAKAILLKLLELVPQHANNPQLVFFRSDALLLLTDATLSCGGGEEESRKYFNEAMELLSTSPELTESQTNWFLETKLYMRLKEYGKATERLTVNVGDLIDIIGQLESSSERINILDNDKFRDLALASMLKPMHDGDMGVKKGILWAERQRGHDFLYSLEKKNRKTYLIESSTFDKNEEMALVELESILELAGTDTAFIVFGYGYSNFVQAGSWMPPKLDHVEDIRKAMLSITKEADKPKFNSYMQDLYKRLIKPWEECLQKKKTKRIIIIPDEHTSLVPFASLICDDGTFLIQKYEICTIPSLRLFKYCEMRRCSLAEKRNDNITLVVANPKSNLLHAEEEGNIVKKFLENAGLNPQVLIKGEATLGKVSSMLPRSCWIHMACHTKFADKQVRALELSRGLFDNIAKFGALELAADEDQISGELAGDEDYVSEDSCCNAVEGVSRGCASIRKDGLLTADQICEGEELRAVITVLSACSSGTGVSYAEGTLGLTRSLHMAGVPTVVASLWKVHDKVTKNFVQQFYHNMHTGMPVATAVQKTMISFIEDVNEHMPDTREPFYWAPFFISGSPLASFHDVSSGLTLNVCDETSSQKLK